MRASRDIIIELEETLIHAGGTTKSSNAPALTLNDAYIFLRSVIMESRIAPILVALHPTKITLDRFCDDSYGVTLFDKGSAVRVEKCRIVITSATSEDIQPLLELLYWNHKIRTHEQANAKWFNGMFEQPASQGRPSALPQFALHGYICRSRDYSKNILERTILRQYGIGDAELVNIMRRYTTETYIAQIGDANDDWMIDPNGANKTFADVLREHGILPPLEDAA